MFFSAVVLHFASIAHTEARVRIYPWMSSPDQHPTWNTRTTKVRLVVSALSALPQHLRNAAKQHCISSSHRS